jgi:hypothetical protein
VTFQQNIRIPVDSRCHLCYVVKIWCLCMEFCPTLRLVYFIAQAQASTCALSSVYSLPCNNFTQTVNPQVETPFNLKCGTVFKDLYVSQVPKNPFVIPPALTRPGTCAFTRDLRFTPPLCDYPRSPSTWDLLFFSASQL